MTNAKKILFNMGSLIIAEIGSQIIGFLMIAVMARQLGVEAFGKYSLALVYAGLFSIFIEFGTTKIIVRETAREKDSSSELISNILALRLFLSFPAIAIMMLTMMLIGYSDEIYQLSLLAGLYTSISLLLMTFRLWFQGFEQMGVDALSRLFERTLASALSMAFLLNGFGLQWVFFAMLGSAILTLMILWYLSSRKFGKLSYRHFRYPQIKYLVVQSLPLVLSGALGTIYFRSDTLMISIIRNETEVGLYNAAYNIILSLSLVFLIYNHAVFPTLVVTNKQDRKLFEENAQYGLRYLMMLGAPMTIGIFMLADPLIHLLYGNDFYGSIEMLQIVVFFLLALVFTSFLGNILIILQKQHLMIYIATFNAVFNVVLNLILIPSIGAKGAAISTVLTECLSIISYIYIFARIEHLNLFSLKLVRIFIAAVLMGVILYFIPPVNLLVTIGIGAVVYAVFLFLTGSFTLRDFMLIKELWVDKKAEPQAKSV